MKKILLTILCSSIFVLSKAQSYKDIEVTGNLNLTDVTFGNISKIYSGDRFLNIRVDEENLVDNSKIKFNVDRVSKLYIDNKGLNLTDDTFGNISKIYSGDKFLNIRVDEENLVKNSKISFNVDGESKLYIDDQGLNLTDVIFGTISKIYSGDKYLNIKVDEENLIDDSKIRFNVDGESKLYIDNQGLNLTDVIFGTISKIYSGDKYLNIKVDEENLVDNSKISFNVDGESKLYIDNQGLNLTDDTFGNISKIYSGDKLLNIRVDEENLVDNSKISFNVDGLSRVYVDNQGLNLTDDTFGNSAKINSGDKYLNIRADEENLIDNSKIKFNVDGLTKLYIDNKGLNLIDEKYNNISKIYSGDRYLNIRVDEENLVDNSKIKFNVDGESKIYIDNKGLNFTDDTYNNSAKINSGDRYLNIRVDEENLVDNSKIKFYVDGESKLYIDNQGLNLTDTFGTISKIYCGDKYLNIRVDEEDLVDPLSCVLFYIDKIEMMGLSSVNTFQRYVSLGVCGTIRANKLRVNLNGCDFVFEENYNLRTLEEVEEFIVENKRLPELKSAAEMENEGTDLGELSSKLLQKIEELTLYTIDKEKKINELEKQNKEILKLLQKLQ